jgi:hypothetical protein
MGLQFQIPAQFAPHLSADIGESYDLRSSELGGAVHGDTFSGAVGARFWLRARTALRGEFRLRSIGWGGTSTSSELTLGIARRF